MTLFAQSSIQPTATAPTVRWPLGCSKAIRRAPDTIGATLSGVGEQSPTLRGAVWRSSSEP